MTTTTAILVSSYAEVPLRSVGRAAGGQIVREVRLADPLPGQCLASHRVSYLLSLLHGDLPQKKNHNEWR